MRPLIILRSLIPTSRSPLVPCAWSGGPSGTNKTARVMAAPHRGRGEGRGGGTAGFRNNSVAPQLVSLFSFASASAAGTSITYVRSYGRCPHARRQVGSPASRRNRELSIKRKSGGSWRGWKEEGREREGLPTSSFLILRSERRRRRRRGGGLHPFPLPSRRPGWLASFSTSFPPLATNPNLVLDLCRSTSRGRTAMHPTE